MIPSGYDTITIFMLMVLISPGVELQLPQCVLAFKHLHVGYRLLPVCSSSALCLFMDTFLTIIFLFVLSTFAQCSSLWHTFCTVELQQLLQRRRWRTERWYGLCTFPSSHPAYYTNVLLQEREPAQIPPMLSGGKHTGHNNKCARWVTIPL